MCELLDRRCEFVVSLTSGGGLSGIDVADNDHVDVHLLLTASRRQVSGCSIETKDRRGAIVMMKPLMEGWLWLTHPMFAVLDCLTVCVLFCFFRKKVKLVQKSLVSVLTR